MYDSCEISIKLSGFNGKKLDYSIRLSKFMSRRIFVEDLNKKSDCIITLTDFIMIFANFLRNKFFDDGLDGNTIKSRLKGKVVKNLL